MDDEVAGLKGATKGDHQLTTVFVDNPTGVVFFLVAKIVVAGFVVAPRQPPAGEFPDRHRRFAVHAQAFDVACLQRLVVFFLMLSKMASVSLSFLRGLALTTLRSR